MWNFYVQIRRLKTFFTILIVQTRAVIDVCWWHSRNKPYQETAHPFFLSIRTFNSVWLDGITTTCRTDWLIPQRSFSTNSICWPLWIIDLLYMRVRFPCVCVCFFLGWRVVTNVINLDKALETRCEFVLVRNECMVDVEVVF